jgi:hypothetical protein
MQRINRHQRDCGCAIWIGNDSAVELDVAAINFRNHQRHVRFHSKGRRVIDHNRTGIASDWGKFSRDRRACTKKRDVDSSKGIVRQLCHRNFFDLKCHGLTGGTFRTEGADRRHWESTPFQHA